MYMNAMISEASFSSMREERGRQRLFMGQSSTAMVAKANLI
jgi:hypothetical protein